MKPINRMFDSKTDDTSFGGQAASVAGMTPISLRVFLSTAAIRTRSHPTDAMIVLVLATNVKVTTGLNC